MCEDRLGLARLGNKKTLSLLGHPKHGKPQEMSFSLPLANS